MFTQENLKEPDAIEIIRDSNKVVYQCEDEEFSQIYGAICKNWWKYTLDNSTFAEDANLIDVASVENIKTYSNRTYVTAQDIYISFIYTMAPMKWVSNKGKSIDINLIAFFIPQITNKDRNTKGFFIISKTNSVGVNEGLYTYYYDPSITSNILKYLNARN